MQEKITFLTPYPPQTIRKTLVYDTKTMGVTTRNANLPKNFKPKIYKVSSLKKFSSVLKTEAQKAESFRVYGLPIDKSGAPLQRKKINFPAKPSGYHIHFIDIDKWKTLDEHGNQINWDPNDPFTVELVIRALLAQNGLYFLDNVDICVLLSASQQNARETISAHVYWQFEAPVTLEDMITVSKCVNSAKGWKVWDRQVYVTVQPDYIAPPIILDTSGRKLPDPIKQRLHYFNGTKKTVLLKDWLTYKTEHYLEDLVKNDSSHLYPGLDWEEILEQYCGNPDINEPSMMAAIRLAYSVGLDEIKRNKAKYARMLYDKAWEAIRKHGQRGNAGDIQRYDLTKFDSYLQYPLNNPIVNRTDSDLDKEFAEFERLIPELFNRPTPAICDKIFNIYSHLRKVPTHSLAIDVILRKNRQISLFKQTYKIWALSKGDVNEDVDPIEEWIRNHFSKRFKGILPLNQKRPWIYDMLTHEIEPAGVRGPISKRIQTSIMQSLGMDRNYNQIVDIAIPSIIADGNTDYIEIESSYVWPRFGYVDDTIYYAADHYNTVICNANGVETKAITDMGVKWSNVPQPAKIADKGYSLKRIQGVCRSLFNFADDESYIMLITWMLSVILPQPIAYLAELVGSPGSGKSELAHFMKQLWEPTGKREFFTLDKYAGVELYLKTQQNHIIVFDNLSSYLPAEISDRFCCFADGSGLDVRLLYANDIARIEDKRSIILTCISPIVLASDLKQRTLTMEMGLKPKNKLSEYRRLVNTHVPKLRRGLFDLAHQALSDFQSMKNVNTGERTLLYTWVASKILGVPMEKAKALKDSQDAINLVENRGLLFSFMAFCENHIGKSYKMSVLTKTFAIWCNKNYGNEMGVYITAGTGSKHVYGAIVYMEKYDNVRTFGKFITRNIKTINTNPLYELRKVRVSSGIKYEITPKFDIL